jgi:hypothetical protein
MKDGGDSFDLMTFLVILALLFSVLVLPLAVGLLFIPPRKEERG